MISIYTRIWMCIQDELISYFRTHILYVTDIFRTKGSILKHNVILVEQKQHNKHISDPTKCLTHDRHAAGCLVLFLVEIGPWAPLQPHAVVHQHGLQQLCRLSQQNRSWKQKFIASNQLPLLLENDGPSYFTIDSYSHMTFKVVGKSSKYCNNHCLTSCVSQLFFYNHMIARPNAAPGRRLLTITCCWG